MTVASAPDRVFITGAAGFIGRALVDRFRALGSQVRGVDLRGDDDAAIVAADITLAGRVAAPRRGL